MTKHGLWAVVCAAALAGNGICQEPRPAAAPAPRVFKSPHFVLHTDLPPDEAQAALQRMESVLRRVSRYWRRPVRGRIECYLVGTLGNWPDAALPHPLARIWVGHLGGATISQRAAQTRKPYRLATVYSADYAEIIDHEIIHAYCLQTFSALGPDWYKEGMAEVGRLNVAGELGVNCSDQRIRALRGTSQPLVGQIVSRRQFTHQLSDSMASLLQNRHDQKQHVPLRDWTKADAERLRAAKDSYAWSWALCHLLVHNPNYAERFRNLGVSFLQQRDDSFGQAFSAMSRELEFEFNFFVKHVDVGCRADLVSWNWRRRFHELDRHAVATCRILAARGYQPSGVRVAKGRRYGFRADGSWSTAANGTASDANGSSGGNGRLVAVVMHDYRLSEPFELGTEGEFVSPGTGDLYLRCRDNWNSLADNTGDMQVKFSAP